MLENIILYFYKNVTFHPENKILRKYENNESYKVIINKKYL